MSDHATVMNALVDQGPKTVAQLSKELQLLRPRIQRALLDLENQRKVTRRKIENKWFWRSL